MKDIEKLKEIFLADDVDEEDKADNLADIKNWESDLIKNKNILGWQEHDITKGIIRKAKESYKDLSLKLVRDRELTEAERLSIYAKQDAMLWLISLAGENPKSAIEQIDNNIKVALSNN